MENFELFNALTNWFADRGEVLTAHLEENGGMTICGTLDTPGIPKEFRLIVTEGK